MRQAVLFRHPFIFAYIISHQNKICTDTESIYDLNFFNEIDGVANALDNIQARLYVDQQCMKFNKPLFESGTLGTKGNVQVVIPKLSENYGASIDPQEKSFPVCTIKNFPNSIEHTIHWARNDFEELFTNMPKSLNLYKSNPKILNELSGNEKGELIHNILYLWNNKPNNFTDCVNLSLKRFTEKFNKNIAELLHAYPPDLKTSSNLPFWSGTKICPNTILLILKIILIEIIFYFQVY